MNIRKDRKSLFLASTILRGRLLKSPDDDGIEVGAGFSEAADKMAGDDNRPPEERGKGATQEIDESQGDDGGDEGDDNSGGDEGDDNSGGDDGDNNSGGDEGGDPPDDKQKTSKYVKEIKRERRQLRTELAAERAKNAAFEARLAALEIGGSTKAPAGDTDTTTRAAPDPNDAAKYPLGVLDDKYIEDKIEWVTEQKTNQALDGRSQTEKAQAENARQQEHLAGLRDKLETLAERGAEQFEDFEENVLEAGLRGDWELTEHTFIAASKRDHGHEILYNLANDAKEAKRVARMPIDEQIAYVIEKNAEIAAGKPKPRTKPKAGDPPAGAPKGRNASNPIRADTGNLKDFKKLWYSTPAN